MAVDWNRRWHWKPKSHHLMFSTNRLFASDLRLDINLRQLRGLRFRPTLFTIPVLFFFLQSVWHQSFGNDKIAHYHSTGWLFLVTGRGIIGDDRFSSTAPFGWLEQPKVKLHLLPIIVITHLAYGSLMSSWPYRWHFFFFWLSYVLFAGWKMYTGLDSGKSSTEEQILQSIRKRFCLDPQNFQSEIKHWL